MSKVVETLVIAILALVLIYLVWAPYFIWNIRKSIDKVARELDIMNNNISDARHEIRFLREVGKKDDSTRSKTTP